eukprot:4716070-Amphidinium_carterae.1
MHMALRHSVATRISHTHTFHSATPFLPPCIQNSTAAKDESCRPQLESPNRVELRTCDSVKMLQFSVEPQCSIFDQLSNVEFCFILEMLFAFSSKGLTVCHSTAEGQRPQTHLAEMELELKQIVTWLHKS